MLYHLRLPHIELMQTREDHAPKDQGRDGDADRGQSSNIRLTSFLWRNFSRRLSGKGSLVGDLDGEAGGLRGLELSTVRTIGAHGSFRAIAL